MKNRKMLVVRNKVVSISGKGTVNKLIIVRILCY